MQTITKLMLSSLREVNWSAWPWIWKYYDPTKCRRPFTSCHGGSSTAVGTFKCHSFKITELL